MGYRDDLAAAHARIAALEAELRGRGGAGDTLDDTVKAELQRLRDENKALRDRLAAAQVRADEVDALRAERDRLVERVRVLQGKVTAAAKAAPAPAPAPARKATTATRARPSLWDHNAKFAPVARGTAAGVACPQCRAGGVEVELVRDLGAYLVTKTKDARATFANVACPRCLFAGLMRTK